jgi:hypothetical protein
MKGIDSHKCTMSLMVRATAGISDRRPAVNRYCCFCPIRVITFWRSSSLYESVTSEPTCGIVPLPRPASA